MIGHREIVSVTLRRADTRNGAKDRQRAGKTEWGAEIKNARRTGREGR
ncbi:hypothetical protein C7S13_2639 [Burkholderia cepacia]|nr:hypothetical protein [Burkholderia cepacia]QOH32807.1 hypothetical protein C7S14_5108 [Burkholderia cepacia]